ncbi:YihY/virulence factor BrkB family protein [Ahrensia sp. R2A130]|uniref:YihY/virulence factor BrkB family protein n=1 Tax=Ahrensia sp. R2A130 TaxID=744979 RepID=UPI0001E0F838|nr:YihY/virulence factor BrkB family protein [Ahrensia sp. R2A130]EFL90480.1 ribonuclease BN [Ahrensia sp. R2A130]
MRDTHAREKTKGSEENVAVADRKRTLTYTVLRSGWESIVKLVDDGGLAIASNVALSLLLSLFPFLMLVASLVRFYGNPELAEGVVDLVLGHWPGDAAAPITRTVETLLDQPAGEFFSFGTVIALILASNGVENARDGLNRAYKVKETRSFLWRRLQGAFFVVVGAVGFILSAFILVATPIVWDFAVSKFDFLEEFGLLVTAGKYSIAIVLLGLILFAFHRYLPDTRYRRRSIIWGILLTIGAILLGSYLFGIYLQNIANYTALYAGLAGMMVAIVYLYCMSVLMLFGAEFNFALAKRLAVQRAIRKSAQIAEAEKPVEAEKPQGTS